MRAIRTPAGLTMVILNAAGLVTIMYPCREVYSTIRVSDHVQVLDTKDSEQTYQADEKLPSLSERPAMWVL